MIHPHTALKFVNETIGNGVFATAPIPMGTIAYALDALDLHFTRDDPRLSDPAYRDIILKYSTREVDGSYTMSLDIARYVNHCCHYNTLTTGYGFEIAVRDIAAGEEITDDYGVFNLEEPLPLACHYPDCRIYAYPDDYDRMLERWDADARRALSHLFSVPQPLFTYIEPDALDFVRRYIMTGRGYRSVAEMRYKVG